MGKAPEGATPHVAGGVANDSGEQAPRILLIADHRLGRGQLEKGLKRLRLREKIDELRR
jgi:hypothetical protein